MVLSLAEAHARVVKDARAVARPGVETVDLQGAAGRVLAETVCADRDQPPFHRSTRDGFAVRALDLSVLPARMRVIGEALAGHVYAGRVGASECVEIMTGAPLPDGADAVVMVETTERCGPGGPGDPAQPDERDVLVKERVAVGENVVPRGSELPCGQPALLPGIWLEPAHIALLASVGCARVPVARKPRVAIVATGDELVEVGAGNRLPGVAEIRNSNAYSLAAQVLRAGGTPLRLPIAKDRKADVSSSIERALAEADLVLLSGGVSMGKYDVVEAALADLGARIAFDGVAIRPGKPVVFGQIGERLFFGLPGNPLSTMVTFELFVRPALALLLGCAQPAPRFMRVSLGAPFVQKPLPLTLFQPCALEGELGDVVAIPLVSKGSGDLTVMGRAGAFLVVPPHTSLLERGAMVMILPV